MTRSTVASTYIYSATHSEMCPNPSIKRSHFSKPTIAALMILAFGAALAAAFHLFRHQASWHHQLGDAEKWEKFRRLYFVSATLSLMAFVIGMLVVSIGAWSLLQNGT